MIDTDKYENHDMIRIAKQLLIEDAPLLLEEVKRLQEVAYLRICMIGERDKEIGRLLEDITRLEQIVRTQKEMNE